MSNQNFEQIQLSFSLNGCKKDSSYEIEFSLENSDKFKTELIKCKTDKGNIDFSKVFLCDYYFSKIQLFKVSVKRWRNRQHFVNFKIKDNAKLSISTLVSSKNAIFKCEVNDKVQESEIIIIKVENPNYSKNRVNKKFALFDYLKSGISFESYIGIDFTKGIEHIEDMESNQYMQAIAGIREILFEFVRDFQVYGYGANLNNPNEYSNTEFFNLALKEEGILTGYTNIEKAYKDILYKITFSKNSSLSPLINKIKMSIISKYKADTYSIIFLLINSPPKTEDYQKCIDYLIENTYLPLSLIVIGIGNNELEEVKKLFNPKLQFSSKGCEKSRNNIHFISMKDCNYNSDILKNKCLKDLPMQIVEYYKINKTTPDNIRENNLDNIKQSFKFIDNKNSLYENEPDDSAPPIYIDASVPPSYIGENSYINNPRNNNISNINNKNDNNISNVRNKNDSNNINLKKNDENDNNNVLYEKPHLNINMDDKNNINQSNNYINGPFGKGKEKNDNIMYRQNPYVQEREKKYAETPDGNQNHKNNEYMSNPYIQVKKDTIINNNINSNDNYFNNNNYINNNINNNSNDKIYNETPKGQEDNQICQKQNNFIDNPYINKKKNNDEEDKKIINNNYNKINNINNNIEDQKYINQTPSNKIDYQKKNLYINSKEEKYYNETPKPEEVKKDNSNRLNPYKQVEEKKLYNQTPNPDESQKLEYNKKYINNPFVKNNNNEKNVSDPFVKNNNENYINNPFAKKK